MSIKTVKVKKAPTWTDHISDMEPESKIACPIELRPTIASLLSTSIKFKFPDRSYETTKVGSQLIIHRLEDKKEVA